ncbi:MAG: succinyldiaminopimelate transaminase [Pseudoclavibacter sp.]|nr:succinyldiaminopimelate transaminase [Pseudoclavibacter sp.]
MVSEPLPASPWEALERFRRRAAAHPGGIVDLSVGSPVDPVPGIVHETLARGEPQPSGYPTTRGSDEALDAVADWWARRRGVPRPRRERIALTIGSKEFIASAALFLGLGPGDVVVHPRLAYPTYAMGARLAGAEPIAEDEPRRWPRAARLVWLGSPGNPDGRVLDAARLRAAVERARELGAVLIGDECYAELGGDDGAAVPSVLDPEVSGEGGEGVLACSSLSKRSNLAGLRAAWFTGDARLVERLLTARRHAGLMVPAPVQRVLAAVLADDAHAEAQRRRYGRRRAALRAALAAWGLRVEGSEAGLYLWGTRGEEGWRTVERLAALGILAAPGRFYGEAGERFVRLALTADDASIAEAVRRLEGAASARL